MPQNVPKIEWTEDTLRVRQHIFEFWAEQKRAPNLREVHEALDLDRRAIIQAYKALQLGIVITVDENTQNANLLKAPPFSSYPSQVEVYVDDEFHSYAGCASESIAISHMPPFEDRDVRLESYCICCLEPITITSKSFEVQSANPESVLMHVSTSPYDWNNVDMVTMCDSMNFVIDAEHADRFERQSSRRGVLCDLDQTKKFVTYTANQRMWDYHWPCQTMVPEMVIGVFEGLGCDVTAWQG
jgi:hypothetical protein